MAFRKLEKPRKTTASHQPMISIARAAGNSQIYMSINQTARKLLGDPAAVVFMWDDEACILRITASSPEDPASYKLGNAHPRISITGVMRELGITVHDTTRIPVTRAGRLAVDADLSDMPTTGLQAIPGRAA